jgi:hypothetical protein
MAGGQSDKAKALLIIAHGQYHSDMRIKESRTPTISSNTNLAGLDTLMEDEEEALSPAVDNVPASQWFEESTDMVTAEMYEKEVFDEEVFSSWDFGKQKEYSCRDQVMPALVCYVCKHPALFSYVVLRLTTQSIGQSIYLPT